MTRETIPCETCGQPTIYKGTKRCNSCWEVENRLPGYLKSPKAWDFVRKHIPLLDDWADRKPDAWDYEAVLKENEVTVAWCDQLVDGEGTTYPAEEFAGWGFSWKHGAIHIGQTSKINARKAAALFVSLWLRGVSASFCDKLMGGYVCHLELQENTRLTFLAEIDAMEDGFFHLTREGFCTREPFTYDLEERLVEALGAPADDEEIIVTFTKRKRQ